MDIYISETIQYFLTEIALFYRILYFLYKIIHQRYTNKPAVIRKDGRTITTIKSKSTHTSSSSNEKTVPRILTHDVNKTYAPIWTKPLLNVSLT